MSEALESLVRDFVEWIDQEPRRYADALEAWRTSCPRLTVWEDATDRGFVERRVIGGQGVFVLPTKSGKDFLYSATRKR